MTRVFVLGHGFCVQETGLGFRLRVLGSGRGFWDPDTGDTVEGMGFQLRVRVFG